MPDIDDRAMSQTIMNDLIEIEKWALRLLSVPCPVPGRTKVELEIMPPKVRGPMLFALPDHTRLTLIDFPLHLPLELLGVETCLQVLTCVLLEHKVALQSKDYNALSMSVMAFVTMIYPLEYMFPVIPLLPSYMSSAEQLLLAPTPFLIGLPSSFFKYRTGFTLPNDVWIVDLDSNKIKRPPNVEDLPGLPDHEGTILKNNLQKIMNSMSRPIVDDKCGKSPSQVSLHSNASSGAYTHGTSSTSRPMSAMTTGGLSVRSTARGTANSNAHTPSSPFESRRSSVQAAGQLLQLAAHKLSANIGSGSNNGVNADRTTSKRGSISKLGNNFSTAGSNISCNLPKFDPLSEINGQDLDSVDVAVRICMVNFFNSAEILANFVEHTRTIRLYPRPIVSFQKSSFLQSRTKISQFLMKLVGTQSVEYLAEWAQNPDNVAFHRIQTGVFDPKVIGDKPKWYSNQLQSLYYQICDFHENYQMYEEIAVIMRKSTSLGGGNSETAAGNKFSRFLGENPASGNEAESSLHAVGDHQDQPDDVGRSPLDGIRPAEQCASKRDQIIGNSGQFDVRQSNENDSLGISPNRTTDDGHRIVGSSRSISMTSVESEDEMFGEKMNESEDDEDDDEDEDSCEMSQSIPVNYQHERLQLPKLHVSLEKHFKPCSKPINSSQEARKWMGLASNQIKEENTGNRETELGEGHNSRDSSTTTELNDGSIESMNDSSSSCDESGTEEFNFASIRPSRPSNDTQAALDLEALENELRLFESVDSDTLVASSRNDLAPVSPLSQNDDNNNHPATPVGDLIEATGEAQEEEEHKVEQQATLDPQPPMKDFLPPNACATDTMSAIISSQKMRISSGVAKLLDRASSMSDSNILKPGLQSSGATNESQSPLAKNLAGEQVGAFLHRFASEAKEKVKDAKSALDAGKTVAGRQKMLENLQNLGDSLFEDRWGLSVSREDTQSTERPEGNDQPRAAAPDSGETNRSMPSQQNRDPDLNELAGKAGTMISGWLGSKASGFANKMRDTARPFGPFPSSK